MFQLGATMPAVLGVVCLGVAAVCLIASFLPSLLPPQRCGATGVRIAKAAHVTGRYARAPCRTPSTPRPQRRRGRPSPLRPPPPPWRPASLAPSKRGSPAGLKNCPRPERRLRRDQQREPRHGLFLDGLRLHTPTWTVSASHPAVGKPEQQKAVVRRLAKLPPLEKPIEVDAGGSPPAAPEKLGRRQRQPGAQRPLPRRIDRGARPSHVER